MKKVKKYSNSIKYRGLSFTISIILDILVKKVLHNRMELLKYLKIRGFFRLGYIPNISKPRSFNENTLHKKVFCADYLRDLSLYADKYRVRTIITDLGYSRYLNELIASYQSVDDFDFESLPNKFVMKANQGSGMNLIVTDKSKISSDTIKKKISLWLNIDYNSQVGGTDYQYDAIKPVVIVEKLLIPQQNAPLLDYKFFCFNGKVAFINIYDNSNSIPLSYTYNIAWEQLSFSLFNKRIQGFFDRPKKLDEMVALCEDLSKPFSFVRIDLYNINENIVFGEYTFTPGGGFTRFYPRKMDFYYGEKMISDRVNKLI